MISIVVPVYNTEKYLSQCVDSLINQSIDNIEIILVNDGSTDSSGKICDDYMKQDNRIKVIHKANGGLSSARNAGLKIASGSYVGFVDSDDLVDREMFAELITLVNTYNTDIAVGNIRKFNEDGIIDNYYKGNKKIIKFNTKEALSELPVNNIITFSACNKIFSRTLFETIRFREGIIFEDMDVMYKLISISNAVIYSSKPMYFYRKNKESITGKKFNLNRLDEYEVLLKMYQFYLQNYSDISPIAYQRLHTDGINLYTELKLSGYDLKKYGYLIEYDNKILFNNLFDKKTSVPAKLKILLYLISPKLRVNLGLLSRKTKAQRE